MIRLTITSGVDASPDSAAAPGSVALARKKGLRVDGSEALRQWTTEAGDEFFVLGHVVGIRAPDGTISSPSFSTLDARRFELPSRIPEVEGRFIVVKVGRDGACDVWTDQFGRVDVYWQQEGKTLFLATSLDLLPVAKGGGVLDPVGAAHALTVYGGRPARRHTMYKDCHRLGIDQGIRLKAGDYEMLTRPFKASATAQYAERDLDRYTEIFLEGIRARTSQAGNIVSLSSGWDSTSILACLVHLVGRNKVRAVIGRMLYSDRSGNINQFEINRAKLIADYFGVRLDIVDLDYRGDPSAYLEPALGLLKSHQLASLTALGQWRIAEATARISNGDESFFTGEMSDGAHNLGFSQYVTIFHPTSQEFREYADKMAGYLFGPTFFSHLLDGTHEQDPVWQLFRQRMPLTKFDERAEGRTAIARQFLSSFFLRGGRIPLYSLDNSPLLTARGRNVYGEESERVYLQSAAEDLHPGNVYSWYLHLYHSFHWQAATVISRDYTAEAHGLRSAHPFQDAALIEFLSAMPESWGRGLDFNPTKYPLKWMLRNRINYPYQLQVGPHSYTYDVNPEFSLLGELLHASGLSDVFKRSLRSGEFVDRLDEDVFDHPYIRRITKSYLDGGDLRGQEMSDLGVIALQSAVGVYG